MCKKGIEISIWTSWGRNKNISPHSTVISLMDSDDNIELEFGDNVCVKCLESYRETKSILVWIQSTKWNRWMHEALFTIAYKSVVWFGRAKMQNPRKRETANNKNLEPKYNKTNTYIKRKFQCSPEYKQVF